MPPDRRAHGTRTAMPAPGGTEQSADTVTRDDRAQVPRGRAEAGIMLCAVHSGHVSAQCAGQDMQCMDTE